MEKEKTEYKSFDKYREAMVYAEAMKKGDKLTAEGALEIMCGNFTTDNFHAKRYANSLMTADLETVMQNFDGYKQLYEKTIKEVANKIHENFLREKLGDQYSEFQKDIKKYSEMTYGDLLKKYQKMESLKKMVEEGTANEENKKEAEELEKDYGLMYLGVDSAEKSEFRKIKNTTEDITEDKIINYVKKGYEIRKESEKSKE